MVRKAMTTVLSSVMLLSMLAACGGTKEEPTKEAAPDPAPAAQSNETSTQTPEATSSTDKPEDIKANLTWFGLNSADDFEKKYNQYIKQKFPNINITYIAQTNEQRMEQVVASGTNIDMYLSSAGELREDWIPANLAEDLTPLIDKHKIPVDTIEPAYLDAVKIDNKTFLLPVNDNKFVMYYNKGIFDKFGVEYPHDGMTWDEAIALGNKITRNEDGKQYLGLWLSSKHYLRVAQNSAAFVNDDNKATVNNDQWKFIFDNIFSKLSRDPGVQKRAVEKFYQHADFNKDFLVGMYVYTTGWMQSADTSLAMDWDIASVPQFKEYPGLNTQPYATYVGITSTSKEKDAAAEVLKYLVSEEYQTIISKQGMITPLKTQAVRDVAFQDYPFAKEKNIGAIFYGTPAPQRKMNQYDEIVIEEAMATGIVPQIVRGLTDVNTAIRTAEDNANKLIQEQIAKQ